MDDVAEVFGQPIARQVLSEHVAQRILALVQTGALKPGQQLPPERELASMLGVSRPSLREALRALSILGILDKRQGNGVFVSALSPELLLAPLHFFISLTPRHLDALFETRIIVESGAARLAAERSEESVIERLESCVACGEKSLGDPTAFLEVDEEFHRVIVQATRNPFMERLAQSLQILGRTSREITAQVAGIRQQTHSDHLQILESLIERDPDEASRAMQQHLRNVRDAYRREQTKHRTSSPEQTSTKDSPGSC